MAISIKTIKGRRHRYDQTSKRVNGRVVTKSTYLGPVEGVRGGSGGGPDDNDRRRARALSSAERAAERTDAEQRAMFGETGQERKDREAKEKLEKLHQAYGLTLGPSVPVPPSAAADAQAEPASENGCAFRTLKLVARPSPEGDGLGSIRCVHRAPKRVSALRVTILRAS